MRERRREHRCAVRTLEASRCLAVPRDPREAGLDRAVEALAQALGTAPNPNGKRHRERCRAVSQLPRRRQAGSVVADLAEGLESTGAAAALLLQKHHLESTRHNSLDHLR